MHDELNGTLPPLLPQFPLAQPLELLLLKLGTEEGTQVPVAHDEDNEEEETGIGAGAEDSQFPPLQPPPLEPLLLEYDEYCFWNDGEEEPPQLP